MKKLILLVALVGLTSVCKAGTTLRIWNSDLSVEIGGYKNDANTIWCEEMDIILPTGYKVLHVEHKARLVEISYQRQNGTLKSITIDLDELQINRQGQSRTYIFYPKKEVGVKVAPTSKTPYFYSDNTAPA